MFHSTPFDNADKSTGEGARKRRAETYISGESPRLSWFDRFCVGFLGAFTPGVMIPVDQDSLVRPELDPRG